MAMTFLEASEWFAQKALEVQDAMTEMAIAGAQIVEEEAKAEIGHYQSGVGPYPSWAPLSPYTQERRRKEGFSPDEPLLRAGELRDSIKTTILENEAIVSTNNPHAAELENGTSRIPPRPFLGRAGYVKQEAILEVQAEILAMTLEI